MSLLQGLFSGGGGQCRSRNMLWAKHVHFPSSMPKFKADKEKEVRATGANWGTQT